MKHLVDIEVKITKKLDKPETVDGKEITEKQVAAGKYCLIKPNRTLKDAGQSYFYSQNSKFIDEGIISRPLLRKKLAHSGGIFTDSEAKDVKEMYENWYKKEAEFAQLSAIAEDKRTEDQKTQLKSLELEVKELRSDVNALEQSLSSLFDGTSEALAKNRSILFWLVNLSHKVEGDKEIPLFNGKTLDEKLDALDEIEDSGDELLIKAKNELLLMITCWYEGLASNQKEFEEIRAKI